MNSNKFEAAMGKTLAAMVVTLIMTLVLAPGAWACKYSVLYKFASDANGYEPRAGLVMDAAGNLYGTARRGGTGQCVGGCGTVFKLTPNADGTWTQSALYSFNDSPDGSYPMGSLIFDDGGNIYGTTFNGEAYGFGTVFELMRNSDGSWTENVLYNFAGYPQGSYPMELIFDSANNLYGTTWTGGTGNVGTVFKLTPKPDRSWTESVLHSFNAYDGRDGYWTTSNLIFDATGNLYGTAPIGGKYTYGIVFKLKPTESGPWGESVIHTFKGQPGKVPVSGLVFDKSGNLYGTTSEGGSRDAGIVFQLTPGSGSHWTYNVLHVFGGKNGAAPSSPLILDAAGNLFGTTQVGGKLDDPSCSGGCGVVFKLTPSSSGHWTEGVLQRLSYWNDGGFPLGSLVFDGAGNLFGTTSAGGTGYGVVFEVTP